MTDRPTPDLDAFETALLHELTAALPVPGPAAPPALPAPLPERRHRRRWPVSLAAAAAAVLAIVLLVPGLGPTPAYAVTGRNDGWVHVKVNRLEGADGLERALRKRGIPADISYLPPGTVCAPNRYTEVRTPGLMISIGASRFEVSIPPGAVGKDDTFVLSAAVVPVRDGLHVLVDYGVAHGAVAPCQVVDGG